MPALTSAPRSESGVTRIENFRLANGSLVPLDIAFTRTGPRQGPAYLIVHGYTGSHHALDPEAHTSDAGWAHEWAGPGKALDTHQVQVITVNLPGSAYGSTWFGAEESYATVKGMAYAIDSLVRQLEIPLLVGVIGYSFGGYVAMQLKTDFPDRVRHVLGVCTAWQGRGHPDELNRLKNLRTSDERRELRRQVLQRSGLEAFALQHDEAATHREEARLHQWANEFTTQALWRLRAAAIDFQLPHCPPNTRLLYASSDALFAPPEPLPPQGHVVQTALGHQSLLYDPACWLPYIKAWLRDPATNFKHSQSLHNQDINACNAELS
jgi:pimeloyl-ACP methyl ester carboxylesterase